MHIILSLVGLLIALVIYFIPAMVARSRAHHNATAIFVANFLLGWTILGWALSLVWAFTNLPPTAATVPASQSGGVGGFLKIVLGLIAGLCVLFVVVNIVMHFAGRHSSSGIEGESMHSSVPAVQTGVPTPADEILGK